MFISYVDNHYITNASLDVNYVAVLPEIPLFTRLTKTKIRFFFNCWTSEWNITADCAKTVIVWGRQMSWDHWYRYILAYKNGPDIISEYNISFCLTIYSWLKRWVHAFHKYKKPCSEFEFGCPVMLFLKSSLHTKYSYLIHFLVMILNCIRWWGSSSGVPIHCNDSSVHSKQE